MRTALITIGNIITLAITAILIVIFYVYFIAKPGDSIGPATTAIHPEYYIVAMIVTVILGILCIFFAYKKSSYYFAFGPAVLVLIGYAYNIIYYLTH